MPGSIHVSVLEAFDLPETISDGEDVAIKVVVGTREYQTVPNKTVGRKTAPWSLDFVFPVVNLRDNLLVILLDENGEAISKSEIDTPSIVEKGSFDINLLLNGGGNVHLRLSFVLTEEERRRIDVMRATALRRREQEVLKISARTQSVPVEEKREIRSSEHHSTPAGSLEEDIEKAGVAKDSSATVSQVADDSQSVPVSQAIHEQSLICAEPGNQEPAEFADLAVSETDSEDQKIADLDRIDTPQPASEENKELVEDQPKASLKSTSSSVKAKVKALEKTRPQGATKQNLARSPSSKIQKVRPHNKTPSRKKVEDDAEPIAKVDEPLHDLEVRRIKNEPLGIQDGNTKYQATKAEQPKHDEIKSSSRQESKSINLVLSGAVSGAVLIAALAFLWAVNPKRRNSSLQQRSTQKKQK